MLKEWGVTLGLLSMAATALLFIFIISFREFAMWFLHINQIMKNQKDILEKLEKLDLALEKNPTIGQGQKTQDQPQVVPPPLPHEMAEPPPPTPLDRFQIHN